MNAYEHSTVVTIEIRTKIYSLSVATTLPSIVYLQICEMINTCIFRKRPVRMWWCFLNIQNSINIHINSVSSDTHIGSEMLFHLTALISLFIFVLYVHFKRRYSFWKNLGVLYLQPSFPTGNVSDFLKTSIHFSYVIQKLYVKLKQLGGDEYGGLNSAFS